MREAEMEKYGQRTGGLFALVGIGIALLMTGFMRLLEIYLQELPWVVVGAIIAALLCGVFGGRIAGRFVARGKDWVLCGIGLSLFTVVVPTLSLSLPFALYKEDLTGFIEVMLTPLFCVLVYGGVPMLFLGFLCGFFLRTKVRHPL